MSDCYQMSVFDVFGNPNETGRGRLIHALKRGTGFTNGKQRVVDIVKCDMTRREKASAICKEYGIGGSATRYKNYKHFGIDYNGTGLTVECVTYDGAETKELHTWEEVADVIQMLVERGEYL